MSEYKVDLDVYNGPLDLLLFLIRRDEVDIYDIPIAKVTEQYVAYVKLIERLDPNLAGEFLVMAATLMEIKSRTLLPRPPVEDEEQEDFEDPRLELVRQLLEYKKYKDAARSLGDAQELQSLKHKRAPAAVHLDDDQVDLEDAQIWDLFDAFQRLLDATGRRSYQHQVLSDDTPIALHAADVLDNLERCGGSQFFHTLFEGRQKPQLIGLFLAVLELIRQRRIRVIQKEKFQPLEIHLLDATPITVNEGDYVAHKYEDDQQDKNDSADQPEQQTPDDTGEDQTAADADSSQDPEETHVDSAVQEPASMTEDSKVETDADYNPDEGAENAIDETLPDADSEMESKTTEP